MFAIVCLEDEDDPQNVEIKEEVMSDAEEIQAAYSVTQNISKSNRISISNDEKWTRINVGHLILL